MPTTGDVAALCTGLGLLFVGTNFSGKGLALVRGALVVAGEAGQRVR